jgi:ParB family chromosome partitioning protein
MPSADDPTLFHGDEHPVPIPVGLIDPDPFQSRSRTDAQSLADLAGNVPQRGLLEPVRVRPSRTDAGRFWAYIGYRRVQAYQDLEKREPGHWSEIPCYVAEKSDEEALQDSLSENIHRQELSALEQGTAILRLVEMRSITQKDLAGALHMDYSYIRGVVAGTRSAHTCPELLAADAEKPLPARLVKSLPPEPALLQWLQEE